MQRSHASTAGSPVAPKALDEPGVEHHQALTGWSGSPDYFRFREHNEFCPTSIVDVLLGRVAGVVFRGMVPAGTCETLTSRFWTSPARRTRGADAPGHYVGAYHYHKTTSDYLDDSAAAKGALDEILDVPVEPVTVLRRGLSDVLAQRGVELRLAEHEGQPASRAILRSWAGQDVYALAPHEDHGQCTEGRQAGFEIQRVDDHQVVAMNVCLENGAGGRLVVWNIKPDLASRQRLGLQYTGSPYSLQDLEGTAKLWLDIGPGDVYLFNGSHVHAVEPVLGASARRVTVSAMFGFIDDRTVVSWT